MIFEGKYTFDISPGKHNIYVYSEKTSTPSRRQNIIFLILLPLMGIIYTLLSEEEDNNDWKKNIRPYYFEATIEIDVYQDMDLSLLYIPAQYMNNQWIEGKLEVNPLLNMKYYSIPDIDNISICYRDELYRRFSMLSLYFIVMLAVVILGIIENNIPLTISMIILMILIAFICYIKFKRDNYEVVELREKFEEHLYSFKR